MKLVDWHLASAAANFRTILLMYIVFTSSLHYSKSEQIISSYSGNVGPGNYSYFSLHEKGSITVVVESSVGDADIYVSENNPKPSFTEYDLQSSSCGLDIVTVPASYKRPVHIAIYGHVHALITEYKITAILDYAGAYQGGKSSVFTLMQSTENANESDESPSLRSILWSVIVGILKIILEVMF